MDHHEYDSLGGGGGGRPPRKELQGPRPAPLKVRKGSHKIRKPPVAPAQQQQQQQTMQQPVIIYTVSPKVIHANPNEFMTLVQRLTGPDDNNNNNNNNNNAMITSSSAAGSSSSSVMMNGVIAPTARYGSFEMTNMPLHDDDSHRGILSPGPSCLAPISPDFFSPLLGHQSRSSNYSTSMVSNSMNFNHGLSSSSSNNFTSPGAVISPNSLEFLHHILNST